MEILVESLRLQGGEDGGAGTGAKDDLPGVTARVVFVEGWGWNGEKELWILGKTVVGLADFFNNNSLGFHGDFELGNVGKRWEITLFLLAD